MRDPIKNAWLHLAADVLLSAIEDVRQERDDKKREAAKRWLLSKDAGLFFNILDFTTDIDLRAWINAGCPILETNEQRNHFHT